MEAIGGLTSHVCFAQLRPFLRCLGRKSNWACYNFLQRRLNLRRRGIGPTIFGVFFQSEAERQRRALRPHLAAADLRAHFFQEFLPSPSAENREDLRSDEFRFALRKLQGNIRRSWAKEPCPESDVPFVTQRDTAGGRSCWFTHCSRRWPAAAAASAQFSQPRLRWLVAGF